MIVKTILGNAKDYPLDGKTIHKVQISADDRLKKIIRVDACNGKEIGICLDYGHLHNGDILAQDGSDVYVVDFLPQNVIVIKCVDLMQMAFVAHSIGNRHTPAVFEDNSMIIEDDYLIAQWLQDCNVPFERSEKVLRHALKHVEHSH